jgi:hypothetical protein
MSQNYIDNGNDILFIVERVLAEIDIDKLLHVVQELHVELGKYLVVINIEMG